MRSAPCKLNNEKHEQTPWTIKFRKERKNSCSVNVRNEILWIANENSWVKLRANQDEIDFRASALRYHFIESLILAQDERWRRA